MRKPGSLERASFALLVCRACTAALLASCGGAAGERATADASADAPSSEGGGGGDSAGTTDGPAIQDAPSSEGGGGGDGAGANDGPAIQTGSDGASDHDAAALGQDASNDAAGSFDVALVDAGSGACNSYAQMAASILETCVASQEPAPHGGTPADGLYYETEFDSYTGPTGMSGACGMPHRFMAIVSGTRIEVVSFDATRMLEMRYAASMAIQGTNMTWTFSCPTGRSPVTFGYDATSAKLVLYSANASPSYSFTLTRQ